MRIVIKAPFAHPVQLCIRGLPAVRRGVIDFDPENLKRGEWSKANNEPGGLVAPDGVSPGAEGRQEVEPDMQHDGYREVAPPDSRGAGDRAQAEESRDDHE